MYICAPLALKYCQHFWLILSDVIEPWRRALDGDMTSVDVRQTTVAAHGVTIHALGELGKFYAQVYAVNPDLNRLKATLQHLAKVDWSKSNPDFIKRVVDEQGGMLSRRHNVKLMVNYFKAICGVPASKMFPADKELEIFYFDSLKIFKE